MKADKLIFLKFGGSLITDKNQAETARMDVLQFLLSDLKQYMDENPHTRVLIGHGSGSFGHHAAAKFRTQLGVTSEEEWLGFQEVWTSARKLNSIFIEQAIKARLPVMSFPPSASLISSDHKVKSWDIKAIERSLEVKLIPVVYGDVVFDKQIGGTIFSTEELFFHLAQFLHPSKILLAGLEEAVYKDFPDNQIPLRYISKDDPTELYIKQSQFLDVTGGMRSKVREMQKLCQENPGTQIEIFSARQPKDLYQALNGQHSGTIIS